MDDLTSEDFAKVATPNSTRLTFDQARELLEVEPTERPRIYCLWDNQIVRVNSVDKLIQYWPSRAIWINTNTTVPIRKA